MESFLAPCFLHGCVIDVGGALFSLVLILRCVLSVARALLRGYGLLVESSGFGTPDVRGREGAIAREQWQDSGCRDIDAIGWISREREMHFTSSCPSHS